MNNIITASRLNCAMTCLRKHFWCYEIGLRKEESSLALKVGSAWARAMEARWNEAGYEQALIAAIPEGIDLNEYDCAVVAALLASYYDYYGAIEDCGKLYPEVQFQSNIEVGGEVFSCQGKIDGLGSMKDGLSVIIEGKTTGQSIDPDSDYWLRLSFNLQVYQYIVEARKLGWDIAKVFYDVTRKPSIRPKTVYDLDKNGNKIVLDHEGKRVYAKKKIEVVSGKGKNATKEKKEIDDLDKPRQSGDDEKGWVIKSHKETPDEYCDRLWRDAKERPTFYFVRREIPVIDDQLASFERQRIAICNLILSLRENEIGNHRDPEAWPRNVSENTCNFCIYKSFCLQNISLDLNLLPEEFSIKPFNPELENYDTTTTETSGDTSSAG